MSPLTRFVPAVVFLAFGLWAAPLSADDAKNARAERDGGYFLLHQVCTDEQQLHLLLMVKTATPATEAFVKRVTAAANASVDELEEMKGRDPHLEFDPDPLPQIELDVRDSIKAEKQHELLFGTTGPAFLRSLLISQIEAASYASNLAKVIGQQESNKSRAAVLAKMSERWAKIRHQAFQLLGEL